jgi:hypothetical protein
MVGDGNNNVAWQCDARQRFKHVSFIQQRTVENGRENLLIAVTPEKPEIA